MEVFFKWCFDRKVKEKVITLLRFIFKGLTKTINFELHLMMCRNNFFSFDLESHCDTAEASRVERRLSRSLTTATLLRDSYYCYRKLIEGRFSKIDFVQTNTSFLPILVDTNLSYLTL